MQNSTILTSSKIFIKVTVPVLKFEKVNLDTVTLLNFTRMPTL